MTERKRETLSVTKSSAKHGITFLTSSDGDVMVMARLFQKTNLRQMLPGWEMEVTHIDTQRGRRAEAVHRILPREVIVDP